MSTVCLAFDTSNYTTSSAFFDGTGGCSANRLLPVPQGSLGLRQSEALFCHVRALPEIFEQLDLTGHTVSAVGASDAPRETEGSYMPCFLAGLSQAKVLARTLGVPCYTFSHQQGHIAAAAWSSGHLELLDRPMLAWHLSGGTTELLYVRPRGSAVGCEIIGGTADVSAGQLIDRTGVLLGLPFPCGKQLDALSAESAVDERFDPKLDGLRFSLSGVEHQMKKRAEAGWSPEDLARFSLGSVAHTVRRVTEKALRQYGDLPVLFSGGVASNSLLRAVMAGGVFAEPRFSTDNAMGTAILTYRAVTTGE